MDRVRILFDTGTISLTKAGALFGPIHLSVNDDVAFPAANWDDFLVILAHWKSALKALHNGAATAKLGFMDGPFEIQISRTEKTGALTLIKRVAEGETVLGNYICCLDRLESELNHSINVLLKYVSDHEIHSYDLFEFGLP